MVVLSCTVSIDTMTSVVPFIVVTSVSTMVVAVGTGGWVIVSRTVVATGALLLVGAEPPSTATTE